MSKVSKFRILIADDDQSSANVIMAHAFQVSDGLRTSEQRKSHPNDLPKITDDERIELAKTLIDFEWINTVSETLDLLDTILSNKEPIFQIAFIDMNFQHSDSAETKDTLSEVSIRGIDIIRKLRDNFPQTHIIVHTKHGDEDNIRELLKEAGIHDFINLQLGDENFIEARGDRLEKNFPRLLRERAMRCYYNATTTNSSREAVNKKLITLQKEGRLHEPISDLLNMSINTLLVGWQRITKEKSINFFYDIEKVLNHDDENSMECHPLNSWHKNPRLINLGFHPIGNLRKNGSGYKRLSEIIESENFTERYHTEVVAPVEKTIEAFLSKGWGNLSEKEDLEITENQKENFAINFGKLERTLPVDLTSNLDCISSENTADDLINATIWKILICRLIVIGMVMLKSAKIAFSNVDYVIDMAILGIISNNPEALRRHLLFRLFNTRETWVNKDATVYNRFLATEFGLSKERGTQNILVESMIEKEREWITNHFETWVKSDSFKKNLENKSPQRWQKK